MNKSGIQVRMASAIEMWPLDRLVPYERNPRTHSPDQVGKIAASIEQFGFNNPLLVDSQDGIIAGHGRLLAARKLGLGEVPVIVLDHLTDAQRRAYVIADNKLAELAGWDDELLALELATLDGEDFPLEAIGFTDQELAALLDGDPAEGVQEAEDEVPPAPDAPITKRGDLWILGDHRLLCGDSTDSGEVERLMNGCRAALMNTDPPYGVSYANDERPNPGAAKPLVANDGLKDEALQTFLETCFRVAVDNALEKSAAWYLWHAHLTQGFFAAAAAAADVLLHRQIIWVKPVLLLGRGQYHWKHEPCFMGWVRGHQPPDYGEGHGERTQTTVWEIGSVTQAERKEFNHATPKPVALFTIPIVKHTKPGEICYEPFAGSGPQFIAAEMTQRRCFGLEIDPVHCDVIVRRWETFTGLQATLDDGGGTFSEISEQRGGGEQ